MSCATNTGPLGPYATASFTDGEWALEFDLIKIAAALERADRLEALLQEARDWIDQRHPRVNNSVECAECQFIARIDNELRDPR